MGVPRAVQYEWPVKPPGGIKAAFLAFNSPALASSIGRVPRGDQWLHEVNFDGYRVQVHIAHEAVKVFTRNGHDWMARFKKIALDAWHINAKSAIIDGEVVVPRPDGITDFAALQRAMKSSKPPDNLVMYAFDLLYLNGFDMRKAKLLDRKELLRGLVKKTDILFSESFENDGAELFKHACEIGLEGVVSKKRDRSIVPTERTRGSR